MSIQANLNQALNLSSLLAAVNPGLAERGRKLSSLDVEEKRLKKELEHSWPEEAYDVAAETYVPLGREKEINERLADIAKERFEASPSDKNYYAAGEARYRPHEEYDTEEKAATRELLRRTYHEPRIPELRRRYAEAEAEAASLAEAERISKSREFARKITEGVSSLSFDPETYTPPKKGES